MPPKRLLARTPGDQAALSPSGTARLVLGIISFLFMLALCLCCWRSRIRYQRHEYSPRGLASRKPGQLQSEPHAPRPPSPRSASFHPPTDRHHASQSRRDGSMHGTSIATATGSVQSEADSVRKTHTGSQRGSSIASVLNPRKPSSSSSGSFATPKARSKRSDRLLPPLDSHNIGRQREPSASSDSGYGPESISMVASESTAPSRPFWSNKTKVSRVKQPRSMKPAKRRFQTTTAFDGVWLSHRGEMSKYSIPASDRSSTRRSTISQQSSRRTSHWGPSDTDSTLTGSTAGRGRPRKHGTVGHPSASKHRPRRIGPPSAWRRGRGS